MSSRRLFTRWTGPLLINSNALWPRRKGKTIAYRKNFMYMENVHELHKMEFCREEFFYRENFGESHQQLDP